MLEKLDSLKETELWKFLNSIDKVYAENALHFVSEINILLDSIVKYFPYYTRHDFAHGIEVVKRIGEIANIDKLKKDSDNAFWPVEAYLLICASFAHDLGMTVLPHEKHKILEDFNLTKEEEKKKLQEYLRQTHSKRGGEYIGLNHRALKIPKSLVCYLDDLMKSHNMSKSEFNKLSRESLDGETVDLKNLAGLLCLADLMEFSNNRVFENVLDELRGADAQQYDEVYSYVENLKHDIVGGNLTIKDRYIQMSGRFDNPYVLDRVHKTVDIMQEWLDFYVDVDLKNEKLSYLKFGTIKIIRNLVPIGFEYERTAISIGKDEVIRLITSKNLWGVNYQLPLRELLQNSIEACRFRRSRSRVSDEYNAHVSINYNKENGTLTIEDNGCGMTRDVIFKNFLTMSNSRSLNPEYKRNHSPIARFGLGFWSVFVIADEAIIRTKAMEDIEKCHGYEFQVSASALKDYTVLKHIECTIGTIITLKLKDDFEENITDIIVALKNVLICSEVDIMVKSSEDSYLINNEIEAVDIYNLVSKTKPNYFEFKDYLDTNNIHVKFYQGSIDDEINYVVGFPYRLHNDTITFLSDDGTYIFNHGSLDSKYQRAICGFVVGGLHSQKVNYSSIYPVYSVFNVRNPEGFEYELKREKLIKNDISNYWADKIRLIEIEKKREFLKEFHVYEPQKIFEFTEIQLLTSAYKHAYNLYGDGIEDIQDLIVFRLLDFEKSDSGYTFSGYRYLNMKELLLIDSEIYFINITNTELLINYTYPNSYMEIKHQEYQGVNDEQFEIFKTLFQQLINKINRDKVTLIDPDSRAFKLFLGDRSSTMFLGDGLVINNNGSIEVKYKENINFHRFIPNNVSKDGYESTHLFGNDNPTYNQNFTAWKINFDGICKEYMFKSDRVIYVDNHKSEVIEVIDKLSLNLHKDKFLMAMKYFKAYGFEELRKKYYDDIFN